MAKLMNWHSFNRQLQEKGILLFAAVDVCRLFGVSRVAAGFLLHRYTQKGYLVRIKRGLYAFPDRSLPEPFLANKIYEPSYVSLEFALSYHSIIPEAVYEVTSVTIKATRRFEKQGKVYSYRRLKKAAFTGYATVRQQGCSFLIADPEKAFVDANYFRMLNKLAPISRYNKARLNPAKTMRYAALFGNAKLVSIIKHALR